MSYRCFHCDWFAPNRKHGVKGKCIKTDEDRMGTDKRCKDKFEKKKGV